MKQENIDQNNPLEEENKRLRNAIAELSIINDVATTINSTQPVEQIVDIIVKKCVKHLNVEQGAVMLLHESDKEKPLHTMIREQQSSLDLLPYRFDVQLTGWMLKNQQPLLVNNLKEDERFKDLVDKTTPIESFLSVPLKVKNKMQGILTVFNKLSNEKFSANDQKLLSIIASQSAQIIENARLLEEERNLRVMQEEMKLAKQTQLNLLPKEIPKIPGYSIAAKTISAKEVGGDYYDIIKIEDNHFAFCLGDVTGKGMPAAMLMANIQATLRAQIQNEYSLAESLFRTSNLLYARTEPTKFVTLFLGTLNSDSNEIYFSNAGHDPPFHFSGSKLKYLKIGGMLLGAFPDAQYEQAKIIMNPGDLLILFSDGITEALNHESKEFSEEKLIGVIKNNKNAAPELFIEKIITAVQEHSGSTPQSDDMTLMIIKRDTE
jgi:sigma-B regulation protein RsbU (phosphoserine phosphatase)